MARQRECTIGCIVFREPIEVCVQRVMTRVGHPTLPSGDEMNVAVVQRMAQDFSFPDSREGIDFCRVASEENPISRIVAELNLYQ